MTLLALSLLALIAPYDAPETAQHGYASAYAPGVMQEVIEARFLNDWWPNTPRRDWYTAAGYIAGMNCAKVGQMATLVTPDGREWPLPGEQVYKIWRPSSRRLRASARPNAGVHSENKPH